MSKTKRNTTPAKITNLWAHKVHQRLSQLRHAALTPRSAGGLNTMQRWIHPIWFALFFANNHGKFSGESDQMPSYTMVTTSFFSGKRYPSMDGMSNPRFRNEGTSLSIRHVEPCNARPVSEEHDVSSAGFTSESEMHSLSDPMAVADVVAVPTLLLSALDDPFCVAPKAVASHTFKRISLHLGSWPIG